MPNLKVSPYDGRPILDIASYARRGPGRRDRLSLAEIAQIARTVRRVPEAVVKVLSRDSNSLASVGRHIDYIERKGELELETDDGERLSGKGVGRQLLEDWDLDLDEHRRQVDLGAALGRKPSKLVHKLMLSMPPGTPAEGVLAAARNFLREEFALKHRYAFVLHTDEPHPHVHAVVKAVSEQGERLNIRKATLRRWRAEFAYHLRAVGVPANATERAVRGVNRTAKLDGIYRAMRRDDSSHVRSRAVEVADALAQGKLRREAGKDKLIATRSEVVRGWSRLSDLLSQQGQSELGSRIREFVRGLPPPYTERELIVERSRRQLAEQRGRSIGPGDLR